MKSKFLLIPALLLLSGGAIAAGMFAGLPIVGGAAYCSSTVNAVCVNTVAAGPSMVTGNELIPADTQLAAGGNPQTVYLSLASLNTLPYQYETPLTGASITVANNIGKLIIDPAGTIATLTVVMPSAPVDGQILSMGTDSTITALTITPGAGQTVANSPTALTISTTAAFGYQFIYRAANTNWYRLQ